MSLINDALKRTRDASFQAGSARPATPEAAQPVAGKPSRPVRRSAWVWVWLTLAVVMVVLAAMLLLALRQFRPIERGREVHGQPNMVVPEPALVQVAPTVPAPVVEKKEEAAIAPIEPRPAPAPVEPPKLVLQGISSGPDGREAMINGNNLREGDELEGVRVVAIETRRVKLQFGTREILLRMP